MLRHTPRFVASAKKIPEHASSDSWRIMQCVLEYSEKHWNGQGLSQNIQGLSGYTSELSRQRQNIHGILPKYSRRRRKAVGRLEKRQWKKLEKAGYAGIKENVGEDAGHRLVIV